MMKRQRCSVPISLLPDDVITDILVNLPVKSIHRFRSVSKTWCSLSSNPNFIKLHLNHAIKHDKSSLILSDKETERSYIIDSDLLASSSNKALNLTDYPFISYNKSKIKVRGYCTGLFCCTFDRELHIWNPSTNEYKTLTKPPYDDLTKFPFIAASSGLGYDCKLDDYKFVIICSLLDGDNFFSEVMVHSLGPKSWNTVKNIPYKVLTRGHGVFLNGGLHWLGTRAFVAGKRVSFDWKEFSFDVIVSFDMVHETVKDVPLPKELKLKDGSSLSLSIGVMRDHLCIFDNNESKVQTQVWVMKEEEENGGGGSWAKLFSIQTDNDTPFSYFLKPIKCLKNGLMLLRKGKTDLVLYDQKHKTFTKLIYTPNEIQAISYVGSLVSLNSTTYFKQQFGNVV